MIDAGPGAVAFAIDAALAADAFPGGVLVVADQGTIVLRRAFGQRARPPYPGAGAAVTLDTMYDAASVTKAAATMTVLLRLAAAGKVDLDAPAQRWLPELTQPGADAIRVWHMCAHAAGFIWWLPFFERIAQGDRDAVLRQIGQAALERPPGTGSVYSDLSFISLGFLCERAGGARLDELHRTLVTAPLGLAASLGFRPLGEPATTDGAVIAPTQTRAYKPDHEHDEEVTSVAITTPGELDLERFQTWLRELLATKGTDIFRMKGILSFRGMPERYVFQGVHMLFDGRPDRLWGDSPRRNSLIFIGRYLDREGRGFQQGHDRFRHQFVVVDDKNMRHGLHSSAGPDSAST